MTLTDAERTRALMAGGCGGGKRKLRMACRRLRIQGTTRKELADAIDALAERKPRWFNDRVSAEFCFDIRKAIRARWSGGLEAEKLITTLGHIWRTGDTPEDAVLTLTTGRSPQRRTGMLSEQNVSDRLSKPILVSIDPRSKNGIRDLILAGWRAGRFE